MSVDHLLITGLKGVPPKDYFESFTQLAKLKILPRLFADDLAQSAGLRNRLAHEYNGIDEREIYKAIQKATRDLPTYLKAINQVIQNLPA